ncbi:MAG: 50S ribosomal protein L3 [Defluviitaleaceae bacterium]|nr:50S ribosomal protein L3 [Defluviitaleaceae bacterium]
MKKAIVAKKLGMTQVFTEKGVLVPVTVLDVTPNVVAQVKTMENDGYEAVQVAFGEIKEKHLTKPQSGHFKKAGVEARKYLREFRFENASDYAVGNEIKADIFTPGDRVDVCGVSKGKGFQGAIKRHGFHRGPMTHGSKYHRHAGGMSAGTSPGKVRKGRKLPGHMGNVKVTVANLEVVRADADKNVLLIKGPVPGPKGTVVIVKESVKS